MKSRTTVVLFSLFLAVLAGLAGYVIGRVVFLGTPITTDENSYVFQAYAFRDGRIARPAPPLRDVFFHEMIINDDEVDYIVDRLEKVLVD